ncbi:MAG: hypothetical protein AAF447_16605 [Myxococcota bacterium]
MSPLLALALVLAPIALFCAALLLRWDGHARLRRDLVASLRDDELRELSDAASAAALDEDAERLSVVLRAIHEAASAMTSVDLARELASWPTLLDGVEVAGNPRGTIAFETALWLRKATRLACARSRDAAVLATAKRDRVELAFAEPPIDQDSTQRVWLGADRAMDEHLSVGRGIGVQALETAGRLVVRLPGGLLGPESGDAYVPG